MGGLCGAACNPMRWRSPFRTTFKNKVSSWQRTTFPTIPVSLIKPSIAAYSIPKQRGLTSEAERCILHCSLWCALHLYAGQSWCIWPVDNMILWAIHRSTLHIWAECYFNHSQICVVHWLIRHFSEHVSRWLTSPFFPSVFCLQINLLIDYSNSKDWHGLQENISHLYQQDDYMSTQADTVRDSECKQWDTGRWWLDEIFWYYVVHRRGVTKPIERGGGSLLHHIP